MMFVLTYLQAYLLILSSAVCSLLMSPLKVFIIFVTMILIASIPLVCLSSLSGNHKICIISLSGCNALPPKLCVRH